MAGVSKLMRQMTAGDDEVPASGTANKLVFDDSWGDAPGDAFARFGEHSDDKDVQAHHDDDDADADADVAKLPASTANKLVFDDSWGDAPGGSCAQFGEHSDDKDVQAHHDDADADAAANMWQGQRGGERVSIDVSPARRFDAADTEALGAYFAAHGYVVVRQAADEAEVARGTSLLWEFLEGHTSMRRDDAPGWRFPAGLGGSELAHSAGILRGAFHQSACCWHSRQLPRVRQAFGAVWGAAAAEQMLASFDGGNIFLPWHGGAAQAANKTREGWWHVDQGRRKGSSRLQGVQGFVALTASSRHTGGLLVVPGSHKRHASVMSRVDHDGDFCRLGGEDRAVIGTGSGARLVVCEAGDLVLWDSRTAHCNACALDAPTADAYPVDRLLRAAVYVCMCPAAMAPPEVLQQRKRAFVAGVGTNHWPQTCATHGEVDAAAEAGDAAMAAMAAEKGVRPENLGLVCGSA